MKEQAFVTLQEMAQIKIVHECKNWIPFNRLETLLCLLRRFNNLSTGFKRKDIFSIGMFERALDRVQTYLNCF